MYIIYKVTISSINTGNNEIDDVKIDIDTIVNKIGEARHYIANMEYIIHNNAKCIITKVGETKPNDKDDDGYYLLINKDNEDRVDIYRKKTKLLEGYLYNSYEIKIEKIAFFEIQYFDKTVNENEIQLIQDIIIDFFEISIEDSINIIEISSDMLNESTDIYEFGRTLNNCFSYSDKVDFICCTFEVAYADKVLHFREEHFIKKISIILNVEHSDLINAKAEIKQYLKL